MITFAQIPLSEIELGRMDAEYYRPNLVELSKRISHNQNIPISRAGATIDCSAFYPSIVPYYDFCQNGVPFLRVNEIQNGLLSIDEKTAFLPEEILQKNRSTIAVCQPGDLIIAKGGNSLGKVALLTNQYPKYSVCRDVLVVRTGGLSKINKFFLWLYLHSAPGQSLLIRTASQTGQPHLTIEAIARLKIPLISIAEQEEIERSYIAAEVAMETSRNAHAKARQILESALGLDKLIFQRPVCYTTQLRDVETSRRFDTEHYFPKFRAFRDGLPAGISLQPLSECLSYCARGKQPIYSKSGLLVINSKHVQPDRIIREGNRLALANPDANLQIRSGDTLLNGTGRGTIGRAAPYLSDTLAVADNHVTILRSTCLDPAFLSLYLNSVAGQMQVEMHQRGTSGQLELYPFDIRKFLVWNAPAEFQREVRDLHDKAAAAAAESQRLLEQAKNRVEQLIEAAVQS